MDLKKETLTKLVSLLESSPSLEEEILKEIKRRKPSEEELNKAYEQSQYLSELIHKRENEPLNPLLRIIVFLLPFLVSYFYQAIPFGNIKKIQHVTVSALAGGLIYALVITSITIRNAWNTEREEAERNKIETISNQERKKLGIPELNENWLNEGYSWTNPEKFDLPFHESKEITKKSETDTFIRPIRSGGYQKLQMTYNFKYPEYGVDPWQSQFMVYDSDDLIISNTELSLHQSDSVLGVWSLSRNGLSPK